MEIEGYMFSSLHPVKCWISKTGLVLHASPHHPWTLIDLNVRYVTHVFFEAWIICCFIEDILWNARTYYLSSAVLTWSGHRSLTLPTHLVLTFSSTQVVALPWKASQAAWRRPWILETWSRMPSITSLQPISSTPSSPRWSEAGAHPCPEATATSAPEGTTKRPCYWVLMTSSDAPVRVLTWC